jgi:short-subunit dehydrogenase
VARRTDRLARLAAELGGEDVALPVTLDLGRPDAVDTLTRTLGARGIGVSLLVNNAGVGYAGRFHEQDRLRLQAMIDLDVRAVVDLTRAFLPAMIERGQGAVLNVVSMSAFQPVPYLSVYAASKAFVLSLTESMATELEGTGVIVQALCPGNIPTEFQGVAGTSDVKFSRTPATTPGEVVEASLAALDRRKLVVIPGLRDRMTVGAQRFIPRNWVRRAAGELFRPSTGGGARA